MNVDEIRKMLDEADDEQFEAILQSYAIAYVTGMLLGTLEPDEAQAAVREFLAAFEDDEAKEKPS